MSIDRVIKVEIKNTKPLPADGVESKHQRSLLDWLGIVVSPTVALVSALVATWAGLHTQEVQADLERQKSISSEKVAALDSAQKTAAATLTLDTQAKLAQLQADNAKAIADLEANMEREKTASAEKIAQLQASQEMDASRLQAETDAKIAQLTADNAKFVADQQEETKRSIASNDERVGRSRLFSELIDALSDEKRAGFALLALWQLNTDPKDRNLISAAALATPNEAGVAALKSLALVDDDVRGTVQDFLARAKASGNTTLVDNAQKVIGVLPQDEEVAYLLRQMTAEDKSYHFSSDYEDQVVALAQANAEVRVQVASLIQDDTPTSYYLRYVLYRAGDVSQLDEILATASTAEAVEPALDLLTWGDFADADQSRVVEVLLSFLKSATLDDVASQLTLGLSRVREPSIDASLRSEVISWLVEVAHGAPRSDDARLVGMSAISLLLDLDNPKAIGLIAAGRAKADADKYFMRSSSNWLYGVDNYKSPLARLNPGLDLPPDTATPEAWADWLAAHPDYVI